ncbi:MAG: hypothetical protein IPM53_03630 [Anaerolineaceae bacterium]|nr:hypothetical protein [Anaerolineaceae bacterium]
MIHYFQKQMRRVVPNEHNHVIRQFSLLFIISLTLVFVDVAQTQPKETRFSDDDGAANDGQLGDTVDNLVYLPTILKPPEFLVIADFDTCKPPNNLVGDMGAACPDPGCPPPDQLFESYPAEPERGCIACLEYHIKNWGAFWMKLNHLDMTPYPYLVFDVRGTGDIIGKQFKIEIKRNCHSTLDGTECYELEINYVGGVTANWEQKRIDLSEFAFPPGWQLPYKSIQDWSDLEELVFTVEGNQSGEDGSIYLDNVRLEK